MRVIGYLGSPRRGGNTETLLDAILAGARAAGAEVEKVPLAARKFSGCQNCGGCDETGRCIVKDQMQPLYEGLLPQGDPREAGGPAAPANLVLASPVFFGGVSAQAKAMIDRCQCLWVRKYRLHIKPPAGRRALLAAVCGLPRPAMFEAPLAVAKIWFTTLGVSPLPPFLVPAVDARGDLAKDEPTLERARAVGLWLGGGPAPGFRDSAPGFLRGQVGWLRPRRPGDESHLWDRPGAANTAGPDPDPDPDRDCQEWAVIVPKRGVVGGLKLKLQAAHPAAPATIAELRWAGSPAGEGPDRRTLEADVLETMAAYAARTSHAPANSGGEKGAEKR